ncbi:hypothetical protein NQZ68_040654 [Dissostichus eleginoides]|nr:hypothetical protein NQZ68_040654 [Dissostichus eleginoides]
MHGGPLSSPLIGRFSCQSKGFPPQQTEAGSSCCRTSALCHRAPEEDDFTARSVKLVATGPVKISTKVVSLHAPWLHPDTIICSTSFHHPPHQAPLPSSSTCGLFIPWRLKEPITALWTSSGRQN